MKMAVSADGTWLLAQCQGSGKNPYEVSCDLADPSTPVGRCNCPSRKFPCKHSVGLMLAYVATPETFGKREPPEELLAKRQKQEQRKEKKAEARTEPRKVNQAALTKKIAAQHDGLDLLEKIVLDLVAGGQWFEAARLERLGRQAKQMSDAYLPGALVMLRRLILLGGQQAISEEERMAVAADLIGRLWATVQKGRCYLEGKLADESQADADAVLEEVLGHAWQLTELREKGYVRQNMELLELAHERADDEARQERVETSYLLDLHPLSPAGRGENTTSLSPAAGERGRGKGGIYRAITYRPLNRLKYVPEQPSYTEPLLVSEAALYPGFPNQRRIRWEKGAEKTEPLLPAHLKTAYSLAAPAFEPVLATFRQQLKHPLAPPLADAWLRCKRVGKIGEQVVLEDTNESRIVAQNWLDGQYNVVNLVRAAGMLQEPAVLVCLMFQHHTNTIVAQPLAALTPETHLRLGL